MAAQSLGAHVAADELKATAGRRRQILLAAAAVLAVVAVGLLAGVSQYAGAKHDLVAETETGAGRFEAVFREAVESRLQSLRLAAEILARDDGVRTPAHQLLIYPVADSNIDSPSYLEHANARPLNRAMMEWFFRHYLRSPHDGDTPAISPVTA